ncbi:MAG: sulfur carrier protein ThiS [Planctomycetia bacterium]
MEPATARIACTVNGEASTLPAGTTVALLVERLALRPEVVAVEIDARLVPRAGWAARVLANHERIEVVTLVGGG